VSPGGCSSLLGGSYKTPEKGLEILRCLMTSSCRQTIPLRNPEFTQQRHELPDGFEGPPGDFWKF